MKHSISTFTLLACLPTFASTDQTDWQINTWAESDFIRNPVALEIDPWGRVYTAETERAGSTLGIIDTRNTTHIVNPNHDDRSQKMYKWNILLDIQLRSVDMRKRQLQNWVEQGYFEDGFFSQHADITRMIVDTNNDGIADHSEMIGDGYNAAVDGLNAGVLWHNGSLYNTCIPSLYKFTDTDGDNIPDHRQTISTGYGVRNTFYGHDLHGLTVGPDGRLYFSIADRGFNVTTQEGKQLYYPDRGAVLRCWPDGSGLEVYYEGLRNPQEIRFNMFGDLFTGDNNSDVGDKARWVYCMEGGDSGWRQDVQTIIGRGPWGSGDQYNDGGWRVRLVETLPEDATEIQRLEAIHSPQQAAWVNPPLINAGAGPSGVNMYPGLGHDQRLTGDMLMADFAGPRGAHLFRFANERNGADYTTTEVQGQVIKEVGLNDIEWGPDGKLYFSCFTAWTSNNDGIIMTAQDNASLERDAEALRQLQHILQTGLKDANVDTLIETCAFPDIRGRQTAHLQLARSANVSDIATIQQAIENSQLNRLQRRHLVWALWCACQPFYYEGDTAKATTAREALKALLDLDDAELYAQVARACADLKINHDASYIAALAGEDNRSAAEAARALGRTTSNPQSAVKAILEAAARNADVDDALRVALADGLSEIQDNTLIRTLGTAHPSADARLLAVLALRKQASPELSYFLNDNDPQTQVEAVRALYDCAIEGATGRPNIDIDHDWAMAQIAALEITKETTVYGMISRILAANFRLGQAENASRLVAITINPDIMGNLPGCEKLGLRLISEWHQPLYREEVWGRYNPRDGHDIAFINQALVENISAINDGSEEVKKQLSPLLARLQSDLTPTQILDLIVSPETHPETANAYLNLLIDNPAYTNAREAQTIARDMAFIYHTTNITEVKITAATQWHHFEPHAAYKAILLTINNNDHAIINATREQAHKLRQANQVLVSVLGQLPSADNYLSTLVGKLQAGTLPAYMLLDTLEAMATSETHAATAKLYIELHGITTETPANEHGTIYQTKLVPEAINNGGDPERGRNIFYNGPGEKNCSQCHNSVDAMRTGDTGPNFARLLNNHDSLYLLHGIVNPSRDIAVADFNNPNGYGESSSTSAMPAGYGQLTSARDMRDLMAYLIELQHTTSTDHNSHSDSGGNSSNSEASGHGVAHPSYFAAIFATMVGGVSALLLLPIACLTWLLVDKRKKS